MLANPGRPRRVDPARPSLLVGSPAAGLPHVRRTFALMSSRPAAGLVAERRPVVGRRPRTSRRRSSAAEHRPEVGRRPRPSLLVGRGFSSAAEHRPVVGGPERPESFGGCVRPTTAGLVGPQLGSWNRRWGSGLRQRSLAGLVGPQLAGRGAWSAAMARPAQKAGLWGPQLGGLRRLGEPRLRQRSIAGL
jgi:hypothetical protein